MSGIGHAIGKVFKGVAGIVKKIWKPLLIAVAIYFTAGAAAAYFGAAEAAGGAAAFAGSTAAATAGTAAAVGGAGLAAGIGTAAAAGATDAAGAAIAGDAAGFGGGVAADLGGASAGFAGDAATGAVADLGGGGVLASGGADAAGIAGDIGGQLGTDVGTDVAEGGANGGQGIMGGDSMSMSSANGGIGSDLTASTATPVNPGAAGQTSSWWDASLNTAGKVLKTPGVLQMISSGINSYQQGQMYNQNLKWMAAHAPGQIQGGVPQGVFSSYGNSQNLAGQNVAAAGKVPVVKTQPQQFSADTPGVGGITTDPRNLPGMNQAQSTQQYPGYGMPGYGQQSPGSGPPSVQQQLAMQGAQQPSIMGGAEMPYVESPYDQSMV